MAYFTGGTATGYDLTLGSHSFIDGFEDQIIGHNIGDTFDVTVTFPELRRLHRCEGNTITLSGKEAVFSVTLNAITQSVVPTLTDEWVESNFAASDDLHTADALRQYFDRALYANNLDNAAMDYLLTNSTFKEVPTQITSYYIRMFLNYHSQLATQYGMELDATHRPRATPMPTRCWRIPTLTLSIWPSRIWSFRPLRSSWTLPPHRSRSTAPTAPTPTPTAHSAVC